MKIWKMTSYIETGDDVSRDDIVDYIDLNLNRGELLYLELENGFKLKLKHKDVKDED